MNGGGTFRLNFSVKIIWTFYYLLFKQYVVIYFHIYSPVISCDKFAEAGHSVLLESYYHIHWAENKIYLFCFFGVGTCIGGLIVTVSEGVIELARYTQCWYTSFGAYERFVTIHGYDIFMIILLFPPSQQSKIR